MLEPLVNKWGYNKLSTSMAQGWEPIFFVMEKVPLFLSCWAIAWIRLTPMSAYDPRQYQK